MAASSTVNFVTNDLLERDAQKTRVSEDAVDATSIEYDEMWEHWKLPVNLMGGTLKMRDAGRTYLPQEPKETDEAWRNRRDRTVLFGAYPRTIKSLATFPFMRDVIVERMPTDLDYLKSTADDEGRDITNFAMDLLQDALHYGKAHYLVEFPRLNGPVTLAEMREQQIRPYFVQVSPENLIGWRGQQVGSQEIITQLRIKTRVIQEVGDFGQQEVTQVRVITPTLHQIYQENKKGEFELVDEAPNDLGKVALVTIYANRTGFLTSRPLLEDLAWLNLRHWQSQSDQDNILHVARVPMLFGSGFEEGELDGAEIGPNRALASSNENASLQFVEHSGQAIGAGAEDLKAIERRMISMGADLLRERSGGRQTATQRVIDQTESTSVLQATVRNLESGLEQGIKLAAEWMDLSEPDVTVDIGEDLNLTISANDFDSLIKLREAGDITQDQLFQELKRRGTLAETMQVEQENDIQEPGSLEDEEEPNFN